MIMMKPMSKSCFICLNAVCSSKRKNEIGDEKFRKSSVRILVSSILQNPTSARNSDSDRDQLQNDILSSFENETISVCTECLSRGEHLLRLHLELEKIQMQILDVLRNIQNYLTRKSSTSTDMVVGDVEDNVDLSRFQDVLQHEFTCRRFSDKPQVRLERHRNAPELPHELPKECSSQRGSDVLTFCSGSDLESNDNDSEAEVLPAIEADDDDNDDLDDDEEPKLQTKTSRSHKVKPKRKLSQKERSENVVTCTICQQTFKAKRYLNSHVRRIHPEKEEIFYCASCPKSFKHRPDLRTHELNRHERELRQCPHCPKMFPQNALKEHLKDKHEENRFHCQFCTKRFATSRRLQTHEETHGNEKKYMCSKCPYVGNTKECLRKHWKRHEERTLRCQYCPKVFRGKIERDNHQRIHTGEKTYKCEECDAAFFNRVTRLRHRKKVHGHGVPVTSSRDFMS